MTARIVLARCTCVKYRALLPVARNATSQGEGMPMEAAAIAQYRELPYRAQSRCIARKRCRMPPSAICSGRLSATPRCRSAAAGTDRERSRARPRQQKEAPAASRQRRSCRNLARMAGGCSHNRRAKDDRIRLETKPRRKASASLESMTWSSGRRMGATRLT